MVLADADRLILSELPWVRVPLEFSLEVSLEFSLEFSELEFSLECSELEFSLEFSELRSSEFSEQCQEVLMVL